MKKAKQFYTLFNNAGREVQIDLNNYRVICNKTGARKSFYHKYLHNMIVTKFDSNIDLFRDTYTSRQPADARVKKAQQIQARIDRLTSQLNQLRAQKDQLTVDASPTS